MKALGILLSILLVALFASIATAATVTITGGGINCTGALTLGSLNVDGNGNVSLGVIGTCIGGTCTPSSCVPVSMPLGTIALGTALTPQTVNIVDNCGNQAAYSAASITSGSNWISSVTGSGTGAMSVTFSTAGLAAGTYAGSITATTAYGTATVNATLTVSPTPPPPPPIGGCAADARALPQSGLGMIIGSGITIPAYGEQHYAFSLSAAANSVLAVSTTTRSWINGETLGIMVSDSGQPACSQITLNSSGYYSNTPPNGAPWYQVASTTQRFVISRPFPAGSAICVTICNRTGLSNSSYGIFWTQQ